MVVRVIKSNLEEEIENAPKVNNFMEEMREGNYKMDLVDTHSKKYLIDNNYFTRKEYRTYKKKAVAREKERIEELEEQNAVAQLMPQIVGAEYIPRIACGWKRIFRR